MTSCKTFELRFYCGSLYC